jgi:hypothetical protein
MSATDFGRDPIGLSHWWRCRPGGAIRRVVDAGNVIVYGVDDRFGSLWRSVEGPGARRVVSPALAEEAACRLLRTGSWNVRRPAAESSRQKDDVGGPSEEREPRPYGRRHGEPGAPSQGPILAVFIPLRRLQADLEIGAGQHLCWLPRSPARRPTSSYLLNDRIRAEDVGLRVRPLPERRAVRF